METARAFFYDPYANDRLEFQFNPAEVSDSKTARLRKTDIPGANLPRISGSGGSERNISFSIDFLATDATYRTPGMVRKCVMWIQSLAVPRIVQPGIKRTSLTPIYMSLGDLMELPVFVENVTTVWGPFVNLDLQPLLARVSLSCTEAPDDEFIDTLAARRGKMLARSWSPVDKISGQAQFIFSIEDDAQYFGFGDERASIFAE